MKTIPPYIITIVFLFIMNPVQAFGLHDDSQLPQISDQGDVSQCISLVRECFSYHGYNRSNCFFTSATHPFCEGSELGALIYRRWVLSPSSSSDEKEVVHTSAQAFLGPQVVDKKCIDRIDDLIQAQIRISTISKDAIHTIQGQLESCKKELNIDLQRQ